MKAARVLAFILVGIGAITGAVVFGQVQAPQPAKQRLTPQPLTTLPSNAAPNYLIQELAPGSKPDFFAPVQDQSAQLVDQYRKAEKEEDKKEIRKKLADELGKQFDARMEQQQKELAALEKQIEDLKKIMTKRKERRTTIIDRRMDQLIQDAEGLGWTAPSHQQHTGFWAQPNYYRSSNAAGRVPTETKRGN